MSVLLTYVLSDLAIVIYELIGIVVCLIVTWHFFKKIKQLLEKREQEKIMKKYFDLNNTLKNSRR